ncbi:MAG: translation initiation factor IF-3 [Phycisphaerales bacterium]|nr:translation initiation factor IF-3 [Phycisphaerales bacterium]
MARVRRTLIARRYGQYRGPVVNKTRVNDEIRITPIRLIDQHNNQVGVVDTRDARRMADEAGLDLVEITPDVRPPVCKIMDYGKYKYELSKKEQQKRAATKQAEMKEVRLGRSAKIDPHDVEIRVSQARRFLIAGHKVQLVQRFRGREMAHKDIGLERLNEICKTLGDIAKVESAPKHMGRQVSLILAPDKPKIEAVKRKLAAEVAKAKAAGQPLPEDDIEPDDIDLDVDLDDEDDDDED